MVGKTRSSTARADKEDDDVDMPLLPESDPSDSTGDESGKVDAAKSSSKRMTETSRRKAMEFRHLHKVFFLRKDLISAADDASTAPIKIVRLRNPVNACATHYICQHEAGLYYDLVRYSEPNRSWLISDVLTIDGAIFMTTLIDPLFLVLPYIRTACADQFVPLDHALKDDRCPDIAAFVDALPMSQLLLIADQKGPADLRAVRYNEEKTLNWLAFKCHKYMQVLSVRGHHIETGAKSETYVKSEKLHTDAGNNARLSLAISLLNEYLPKPMHAKLLQRLGAEVAKPRTAGPRAANVSRTDSSASTSSHKRRPTSEAEKPEGSEKRAKDDGSSGSSSDSPATPKTEEKKSNAKERALAKAATGTKGILSFFKRK